MGGSCGGGAYYGDEQSCKNESFRIKLNPVCPKKGAPTDRLWYSKAAHPILAVEARRSADDLEDNLRSHFQPYLAAVGPVNYQYTQTISTVLMISVDLAAEPLFGPKFPATLTLDYSKLGLFPTKGKDKVWITLYVCDDTNRNGKCSDELVSEQIANLPATHQACHFPSAVPLDVWHCR